MIRHQMFRLIALLLVAALACAGAIVMQVSVPQRAVAASSQCGVNLMWANNGPTGLAGTSAFTAHEYISGAGASGEGTLTGRSINLQHVEGGTTIRYVYDIAIDPTGTYLYGLNLNGDIGVFRVSDGSFVRKIVISGRPGWAAGADIANSLSFTTDGTLLIGGSSLSGNGNPTQQERNVYALTAAQVADTSGNAQALSIYITPSEAAVPFGWTGDFITMADGSIIGLANRTGAADTWGTTQLVRFTKDSNGVFDTGTIVGVPTTGGAEIALYGGTFSHGSLYFAGADGYWYRLDSVPTVASSGALPLVKLATDFGIFNGATSQQEDYAVCSSPSIDLVKTAKGITGPDAAGVYTSKYAITVSNTGTGPGTYGPILDTASFDPNLQIQSASWSGQTNGNVSGAGPYKITNVNTNIANGVTHTYNIEIRFKIPQGVTPSACGAAGTGSYNNISLPAGDETSTSNNSACNTVPTPTPPKPVISLAKSGSLTPTSNNQVGDKVTYTFTVTNSGTVPVQNLTISDPLLSLTDAPINTTTCSSTTPAGWTSTTSLAVGASVTCVAATQYALTQTDINAGKVDNTATAKGATSGGVSADPVTASATVTPSPKKELTLTKAFASSTDVNGNGALDAGDKLFYTFTLTNTGTVTLKNPSITDAKLGLNAMPVNATNCTLTPAGFSPTVGIAPGGAVTCAVSSSYTVLAIDVTNGKVTNTATSAGVAASDGSTVTSNQDTKTVTLSTPPNVGLTKTAGAVSAVDPATGYFTATYTVTLSNTGQTPTTYTVTDTPKFDSKLTVVKGAWTGQTTGTASTAGPYTLGTGTIAANSSLTWNLTITFAYAAGSTQASSCQAGTPNAGLYNEASSASGLSANACLNPPAPPKANLSLVKSAGAVVDANGNNKQDAGDTITYSFLVTNTGTVTLTGVIVTDAKAGTVTCSQTTLAPGASTTCSALPHVITQGEMDAKVSENSASATATPPPGVNPPSPTPTSSTSTPLTPKNAMTLLKERVRIADTNNNGLTDAGDVIYFQFTVRNTGTSTLSNITIKDNNLGGLNLNLTISGSLAPGSSVTVDKDNANNFITHTITVDDMNAGSYVNTATSTATGPGPETPSSTSTVTTTPSTAPSSLTLVKDALPVGSAKTIADTNGNGRQDAGDTITYRFTITNTSLVSLTSVSLTDAKLGRSNAQCGSTTLAPGASTTCDVDYVLTVADVNAGNVPNTATAKGTDPSNNVVTATSNENVPITQTASIKIVKTAGTIVDTTGNGVSAGDTLEYTLEVTNDGATTLSNVTITDPKLGSPIQAAASMVPGAIVTIKRTYVLTQDDVDAANSKVVNTASVTGTPPPGVTPPTSSSTVETPFTPVNKLSLDKQASAIADTNNSGRVDAGDTITYTFVVTNTGNTTLTALSLTDPNLNITAGSPLTATGITLRPNETYTFTTKPQHVLTQAEINAGSYTNTATVTGTGPGNTTAGPASDSEVSTYTQTASIGLVKSAAALTDTNADGKVGWVGDDVTYTFTLTNTSAVTLTSISLSDSALSFNKVALATTTPCATLTLNGTAVASVSTMLPKDVVVCVAATKHRLTQPDVDAGFYTNTATAYGVDPKSTEVSAPAQATVTPTRSTGITVKKTNGGVVDTNNSGTKNAGDHIVYTFEIKNTGLVTLSPVFLTDTKLGITNLQVGASLAPDATMTWIAPDYIVKAADVTDQKVVNNVTVSGTPPSGLTPPTGTDTNTVPLPSEPKITLTKSASLGDTNNNGFVDRGETVQYTFVITNMGNTPLVNVSVTDPLLSSADVAISCGTANLAAGESTTCTASMVTRQAILDTAFATQKLTNTATATGTPPGSPAITSPPATANVPTNLSTKLTLAKTAWPVDYTGDGFLNTGDWLIYYFALTNDGTATLTDLTVSDPMLAAANITITCPAGPLLPKASVTCQGSGPYTITATDSAAKKVDNIASAAGKNPTGGAVSSNSSTTSTPLTGLTLLKTKVLNEAPATTNNLANVGETITYRFAITNTGGVTMTTVMVRDDDLGMWFVVDDTNCTLASTPATPAFDPAVGLTAGSSVTCTLKTPIPVTKEQVDAGVDIPNKAVAMGFDPKGALGTSNESSTATPVDTTARLTIVKSANPVDTNASGKLDAGDKVTYSFLVTNTGAVTVSSIVVTDAMLAGANVAVTCPSQTLDAGASTTCTSGEYTITAADQSNKAVNNQASVSGEDPHNVPVTAGPSSATVPLGALTLAKTAVLADTNANSKADAGETITYRFKLTNSGGGVLKGLTITDARLNLTNLVVNSTNCTLTPTTFDPAVGLASGSDVTCELPTPYSVTAADVALATPLVNTATAKGTDPNNGTVPSNQSSTQTPVNALPGITMVKSSTLTNRDANPLPSLGDLLSYSFLVTNSGNTNLTGVAISDNLLSAAGITVTCPATSLVPGASTTCTSGAYTITAADVAAGSVANTATATSKDPNTPTTTSPPSSTATAIPGLALVKTRNLVYDENNNWKANVGDKIAYTFQLTNTGGSTLKNLTLTDSKLSLTNVPLTTSNCTFLPSSFDPTAGLAPNTSVTCTYKVQYAVTQADVDARTNIVNTASVAGTEPGGATVSSPVATTSTPVDTTASLTMQKSVTSVTDSNADGYRNAGDKVVYSFLVTNTGAVSLTNVKVSDPKLAAVPVGITCPATPIAAGASLTCTSSTYTITAADVAAGSVTNTATATGTDPSGATTPPSPPSSATVTLPRLTLTKTADKSTVTLGDKVSYTFTLVNSGTDRLINPLISDDKLVVAAQPINNSNCATIVPTNFDPAVGLAPGAQVSCTWKTQYAVTQTDVDARLPIVNTASATATDADHGGVVPSGPATAQVVPTGVGKLALVKSGTLVDTNANGMVDAGEFITYKFLVTNVGTYTVTSLAINDPHLAGLTIACDRTSLAPAQQATCTADNYTVTPADIAAKKIDNTATAKGKDPAGADVVSPPASKSIPITPLTLTKSAQLNDGDGDAKGDVGESVTYTFTLGNVGTEPLLRPTLTDSLLAATAMPLDSTNCAQLTPSTFDPAVGIAPGASVTCMWRMPYTLTQADLTASIDKINVATAGAELPSGGKVPSDEARAAVRVDSVPRLKLIKSAELQDVDGNKAASAHERILYTFVVTNIGQVTVANITVEDAMLAAAGAQISCAQSSLVPGASTTCAATPYIVTYADARKPTIDNVATAKGVGPKAQPTDPDVAVVSNQSRAQIPTSTRSLDRGGDLQYNPNDPTSPNFPGAPGDPSPPLANTGAPWAWRLWWVRALVSLVGGH